jgi:hypothetical protein
MENKNILAMPSADKLYNEDNGGVSAMDNEKYVTKDLLDAKFETISTKIDAKIDQIPLLIENALNKQENQRRIDQSNLIRWIIGTSIALFAATIGFIKLFM